MSFLPRLSPQAMPLSALLQGPLQDRHGRIKRKLRVSLTDRCNFRCPYCIAEDAEFRNRSEQLTLDELRRLLRLFVAELGIGSLRLTGGEPLLRRDLEAVVAECGTLRALGLERISLTTNAALLSGRAAGLRAAGLDDLNISLDALTPQVFATLSGGREVQPVQDGIAAARAAGLPFKLNTVVLRGINEGEILPLARWAVEQGDALRFIEFMPLDGRHEWSRQRVVSGAEILEALRTEFSLVELPRGSDPAAYYAIQGTSCRIGIITTVSNPFCASCDRLRLTADGKLYTCLFSANGVSLREPLRAGADDRELAALIRDAVWHKGAGYAAQPGYAERSIAMNALGG